MDFKEYLRILRRRWPWIIGAGGAVAVALSIATMWQSVPYFATGNVHFKQTPLELGFFQPDDYTYPFTSFDARSRLFTHPEVLQRAEDWLKENKTPISKEELKAAVTVQSSELKNTVTIRAQSRDQNLPPKMVQAVYHGFVAYEKAENKQAFAKAMGRVQKSLEENKNLWSKIDKELRAARKKLYEEKDIADPDLQAKIMSELILTLERTRYANKIEVRKIDQLLSTVSKEQRRIAEESLFRLHAPPFIFAGPGASESAKRLLVLETKLAELRRKYFDVHPKIQELLIEVRRIQSRLAQDEMLVKIDKTAELLAKKRLLLSTIDFLKEIVAGEYKKLSTIQQERNLIGTLQADLIAAQTQRRKLQEREEKLKESQTKTDSMTEQSIVVINRMETAMPVAIGKRVPLYVILLVSVIIGLATGFVVDFLADSIRTSHDVRAHLNLPTIATLPLIRDESVSLLHAAVKSPVHEIYSKLAVFLESQLLEHRATSILFTSTKAEEGKSTVSSNTAIALAQAGKRVILVDSDIRKPQFHMIFSLDNSRGLTTILSGEFEADLELREIVQESGQGLDAYLQKTPIENLRILTAGPVPPNPISLLKAAHMSWLVDELNARADVVIFDSPPVMGVVDAAVLAKSADLTVLLVAENEVRRSEAAQVKHALSQIKANTIGVVLNKAKGQPDSYYYYYYYGQQGRRKN